uniref:Uncharacterized protein n=1 Tax=Paracidobacterium acidisoli TaxID=2303751 RepID=A0A372IQV9_9BACT
MVMFLLMRTQIRGAKLKLRHSISQRQGFRQQNYGPGSDRPLVPLTMVEGRAEALHGNPGLVFRWERKTPGLKPLFSHIFIPPAKAGGLYRVSLVRD